MTGRTEALRKRKGKSPASSSGTKKFRPPPPPVDTVETPIEREWFLDNTAAVRWESFQNRDVIPGRSISLADFISYDLQSRFDSSQFTRTFPTGITYNRLVRLFYCNARREKGHLSFDTLVRDTPIHVTSDYLSDMMHIPRGGICPWGMTLHSVAEFCDGFTADKALQRICKRPWADVKSVGDLSLKDFYTIPRLVLHMLTYNIIPRAGNRNDIQATQLVCAFCVSMGIPVDWGNMILHSMLEHFGTNNKSLPFGRLLSRIFEAEDVDVSGERNVNPKGGTYDSGAIHKMGIKDLESFELAREAAEVEAAVAAAATAGDVPIDSPLPTPPGPPISSPPSAPSYVIPPSSSSEIPANVAELIAASQASLLTGISQLLDSTLTQFRQEQRAEMDARLTGAVADIKDFVLTQIGALRTHISSHATQEVDALGGTFDTSIDTLRTTFNTVYTRAEEEAKSLFDHLFKAVTGVRDQSVFRENLAIKRNTELNTELKTAFERVHNHLTHNQNEILPRLPPPPNR